MDNKKTLQNIFLFGIFAVFFALLLAMLYPFFTVILWTVLLYILLRPIFLRALNKLDATKKSYRIKEHALAGSFALGTLLLIIGPLSIICVLLVQQCMTFLHSAEAFINSNSELFSFAGIMQWISDFLAQFGIDFEPITLQSLQDAVLSCIQNYSSQIFSFGTSFISKTGNFFVSMMFVIFALYFCFVDGSYLAGLVKKAIPIKPDYMSVLTHKFTDITKNLFAGYILVALYQGVAAFVIFICFGVESALFLSVLLMFSSFIPIFGAALVWVPVGIIICLTGSLVKGILFLIIAGVCISFLDNFLRPFFLKDRINVHPLVIFFAILGGISVFGLNGLILGPLVVILFFTIVDLLVQTKSNKTQVQKVDKP